MPPGAYHCGDTNEPPARVEEGAAAVARVDCGVVLHAVADWSATRTIDVAAERRDDARGECVVQTEWVLFSSVARPTNLTVTGHDEPAGWAARRQQGGSKATAGQRS